MKTKAQIEYEGLLKTGMFYEFYPNLSGNYEQDKESWKVEYRKLNRTRKKSSVKKLEKCPLCDIPYGNNHKRKKTLHHIFPRAYYKSSTLRVEVCRGCHDNFHRMFKYNPKKRWSKTECIQFWCAFCFSMGKNATRVYPELL